LPPRDDVRLPAVDCAQRASLLRLDARARVSVPEFRRRRSITGALDHGHRADSFSVTGDRDGPL